MLAGQFTVFEILVCVYVQAAFGRFVTFHAVHNDDRGLPTPLDHHAGVQRPVAQIRAVRVFVFAGQNHQRANLALVHQMIQVSFHRFYPSMREARPCGTPHQGSD